MAALPSGDVWVLFQQRPWLGAAVEFAYYPREEHGPSGVGRCANGKWEFPVELDGVPATITREFKGPNGIQRWEIETSAALWLVTHGELIRVDRAQLD
jgi:hypothetical protein